MVDTGFKTHAPLDGIARTGRFGGGDIPGLTIEEQTDLALATVLARRGRERAFRDAVVAAYGIEPPDGPRLARAGDVSFAGIGVGQWMAAAHGEAAAGFVAHLRERLAGLASVMDQSDGRVVLKIYGDRVRDVLAKGVPVDLHPWRFKTGDVATTLVAHIGVQLAQLDDRPTYQLMAFRSLAGSLWSWLTNSAAEYGYEVLRGGNEEPSGQA